MNCLKREKLIALYVEGDLPQKEAAALVQHLHGCLRCQRLVHRLRESQSLLKSVAGEPLPAAIYEDLPRKVMNEIAAASSSNGEGRFPWDPAWRWILSFAAAGAVVIAGIWFGLGLTGRVAKENPMTRQSVASAEDPTKSHPLPFSSPKPISQEQQLRKENLVKQSRRARFPESTQAQPRGLLFKRNPSDGEVEGKLPIAQIHKAMALWQEMAANLEERKKESTMAKSEEASDRMVAKLTTKDPNILIYWLEDAGKGKSNEIQN